MKHDEIGVIAVNDPPQFLFEGLAVGVERVIHSNRVDSLASGRFKTLRERTVRDHGGDPGRNRALPLFGAGGFENGLEVRAASGNKDDDIFIIPLFYRTSGLKSHDSPYGKSRHPPTEHPYSYNGLSLLPRFS